MDWFIIIIIFLVAIAVLIAVVYKWYVPIAVIIGSNEPINSTDSTDSTDENNDSSSTTKIITITGGKKSSLKVKNLIKHPRSRSEAEVIKHLEEITGDKFPTVNPKWLVWKGKTLELDGFNGKIALEFSGPLHTKWNPSVESYIDYFERVVKDVVKLRTCKKRGIPLIVVDVSLPREHWRTYLLSRLYDIGVRDKPINYIDAQVAKPFRNPQLENELGLDAEMAAANRI